MTSTTDRAALARRLSSRPDAERESAATAQTVSIVKVALQTKVAKAHAHQFRERLNDLAFELGTTTKWVGVQAGLEELVMLALTDQRTWDLLAERVRERVREQ